MQRLPAKATISGKTVYLDCGATSRRAVQGKALSTMPPMGNALYKSAGKGMLHGTWSVKGNTSCTDWKEAQQSVQQI